MANSTTNIQYREQVHTLIFYSPYNNLESVNYALYFSTDMPNITSKVVVSRRCSICVLLGKDNFALTK